MVDARRSGRRRRWLGGAAAIAVGVSLLAGVGAASARHTGDGRAAQSGVIPAGSCNPACVGPKTPQGDPRTLFGGPRGGEIAPQPRGYGAASLQAEAHNLLLEVFGPQIGAWEYALARRAGGPLRDVLTTRNRGRGVADFTLRIMAGARLLGTARWRVRWWDVPLSPATARAFANNDLGVILPAADALARRLESFPPDARLPRTDSYEVEVDDTAGFLNDGDTPRDHIRIPAPYGLDGFIPEYVVRRTPPDFALVRGERAVGNPSQAAFFELTYARDVRFLRERFDGVARDTAEVRLSTHAGLQQVNHFLGTIVLGWKTSHIHGKVDLRTLMRTPVDTVTIDTANLLGPPN